MGSNTRPNNIWHQITHNKVDTVPLAPCIRADYFCLPSILERSFRNAHSRLRYWALSLVYAPRNSYKKVKPCKRRLTPAERAIKRSKQRFYTDLDDAGRIALLRAYWCLPFRNDSEKLVRREHRLMLFRVWGLRGWDITNAVIGYGDVVKSIRRHPDYAHLHG
jgi:hypothetical protein